jgi:hypothetical protein
MMSSDSKTATAAPERQPLSLSKIRNLAFAGLFLAGACASPAPPAEQTPRTEPAPASAPQASSAPAPEEPAPVPEPEERGSQAIVLDPGGEQEGSTRTLVEAAREERERRAHAAPSAIVINDKNLKQHATGQLTVATPGKKSGSAAAAGPDAAPVRDEQYWRSRALEIRLRWRHAADDIKELETSANGWRRSFYAEKDPNVRNARIKPEWDRVLDRLEEARAEVETSQKELAEFLEEGRTAGALPGWLREGVDQEPQDEPEPSNTHKVIEPPTADNKDGHGA